MAYYLTVETKRGEYLPINISNSKCFQDTIRRFKKTCAYTLEEIDRFTMMFNDEIELRERLFEEGILSLKYFDKPLSIRYSLKDEYIKVPNDFLYQDDLEYIYEPARLVKHILKRYYDNDFQLIKRIVNKFSEYRRCQSTIPEVRQFIEISIREGKRCSFLDEIDENGDNLIVRLIKLIILESYDDYKNGKVIYKDKLNYRNLHDLIALIKNYDKKKEDIDKVDSDQKEFSVEFTEINTSNSEPVFTSIENKEPKITVKTKTKKKPNKNYNLDGQMDFTSLI